MIYDLNDEQKNIIATDENLIVSACPGSGKTRVLTCKIGHCLDHLKSCKKYVVALTFTNRAADEIHDRIENLNIFADQLWVGTIHSFCLDWILKPYSGYCPRTRNGFTVIDEYTKESILNTFKDKYNVSIYTQINTRLNRNGSLAIQPTQKIKMIIEEYNKVLLDSKLIDFDLILYISFFLLCEYNNIPLILSKLFSIICIDEYQDTQDLQYAILTKIVKAGKGETKVMFVGDPDQAIYDSLGGEAKSISQITKETGNLRFEKLPLSGNYRSSQRIINFYRNFQLNNIPITALGKKSHENGLITLNKTIHKDDLAEEIARLIKISLSNGVPANEICVIGPQWYLITPLARKIKKLLPNIPLDAPGLSPLRKSKENIWFKIARLFLTEPSPNLLCTRIRWANEIIDQLSQEFGIPILEEYSKGRNLLRLINSITFTENDGLEYLKRAFKSLMSTLKITAKENKELLNHWNSFFTSSKEMQLKDNIPSDIVSLKSMFNQSNGVVINTCHGTKGEGLLGSICELI